MLKPLVWHTPNPTTEGKTRSSLSMSLFSHCLKILVDRVFWHAIGFMWSFVFAVVFIADNFSFFSVSWLLVQLRDRDPYLFTWISYCKMSFKLPGLADKDKLAKLRSFLLGKKKWILADVTKTEQHLKEEEGYLIDESAVFFYSPSHTIIKLADKEADETVLRNDESLHHPEAAGWWYLWQCDDGKKQWVWRACSHQKVRMLLIL